MQLIADYNWGLLRAYTEMDATAQNDGRTGHWWQCNKGSPV